jgi:hypothetical protein
MLRGIDVNLALPAITVAYAYLIYYYRRLLLIRSHYVNIVV